MSDPGYKAVDSFLQKIPQDLLAHACFSCGAYTRALMHFEQFLSSKNQNVQDHLDFLQVCCPEIIHMKMTESDEFSLKNRYAVAKMKLNGFFFRFFFLITVELVLYYT
jgi:hypothetical protein